MRRLVNTILFALVLVLVQWTVQACYYDIESVLYHQVPVNCGTVSAKFSVDVQPIINTHCATSNCHNSTGSGNTVLQTYDQIKGKLDRINQRVMVDKTMPPNGKLTTSELNILKCWIEGGALNN